MNVLLEQRHQVARHIMQELSAHSAVISIVVFGSVATGMVDEHSDVDMLLICKPDLIQEAERALLLKGVGSGWQIGIPTDNDLFAAIDEGGIVDGIPVTLHYQRAAWIDEVLGEVVERGAVTTMLLPFRPYTLPALLQRGWLLYDANQDVRRWREEVRHYPPLLKHNIIQRFKPILQEQTDALLSTAVRGIGPANFLFHLSRSVDALISIVYALNDVYDPADRRASQTVWPLLDNVPMNFVRRLTTILEGPFDSEGMRLQAQHYVEMVQEVMKMLSAPVPPSMAVENSRE